MRRDPAYRFALFALPQAPWRATIEEAHADAIDAGYASVDPHSKTVWLTVPAEIWTTLELVPVHPREPKNGPTSTAAPTRIERIIARREGRIPTAF